jgi:hypothetical protein
MFTTFFISFEANVSKFGSHSINIRKFRDIHKHHLFASFASKYLHKYAYVFNLMINKYMLKLVFALEPIFPSHFSYWLIFAKL